MELYLSIAADIDTVTNRNQAISGLNRLLLDLRFYATGSFLMCSGDFSGVSLSTAASIVRSVRYVIASRRKHYMKMPATPEEIEDCKKKFYVQAKFPRIVVVIDYTHVKIQSPGGKNEEVYRCRKGYFSKNVQAVCEPDLEIMDIVTRWPGSAHDQTIFNASRIRHRLEADEWPNSYILGNSRYECRKYIIALLAHPTLPKKNLFNESFITTRNTVERCFGILKRRFPALSLGIRCRLDRIDAIVVACAVFHNLAIKAKESTPDIENTPDYAEAVELDDIILLTRPVEGRQERFQVRQNLIDNWFAILLKNI